MGRFTNEQLLKLQQNLKVGRCPNCGYEGNKDVCPEEMHLVSLDIDSRHTVGLESLGSYPVVMAVCPNFGFISLFSKKFLCR